MKIFYHFGSIKYFAATIKTNISNFMLEAETASISDEQRRFYWEHRQE
jgi:hypothetical protein